MDPEVFARFGRNFGKDMIPPEWRDLDMTWEQFQSIIRNPELKRIAAQGGVTLRKAFSIMSRRAGSAALPALAIPMAGAAGYGAGRWLGQNVGWQGQNLDQHIQNAMGKNLPSWMLGVEGYSQSDKPVTHPIAVEMEKAMLQEAAQRWANKGAPWQR